MNVLTTFSGEAKQRIEEAIEQAEERTSAEFVCCAATESDHYDREEAWAGLFFGLVFVGLFEPWRALAVEAWGGWSGELVLSIGWQAAVIVAGFLLGGFLAQRWFGLRRLLVSSERMHKVADETAQNLFYRREVRKTEEQTGVLIYVSLFERRVRILADETVDEALEEGDLEDVRDFMVDCLREGRYEEAFTGAVEQLADRLADRLPPREVDPNELVDELHLFHRRP
ncbi:MAG: TPM domain-containing protein [Persicimonas sp.]